MEKCIRKMTSSTGKCLPRLRLVIDPRLRDMAIHDAAHHADAMKEVVLDIID